MAAWHLSLCVCVLYKLKWVIYVELRTAIVLRKLQYLTAHLHRLEGCQLYTKTEVWSLAEAKRILLNWMCGRVVDVHRCGNWIHSGSSHLHSINSFAVLTSAFIWVCMRYTYIHIYSDAHTDSRSWLLWLCQLHKYSLQSDNLCLMSRHSALSSCWWLNSHRHIFI